MMGHREPIRSGDEADMLWWKHRLCVFRKSRIAHATKKKLARRARKTARLAVKSGKA